MRNHLFVAAFGFLSWAAQANAADKTVHDRGNGFSLTFPGEWINEPPSDKEILLTINSGERGLTCMVSGSLYNPVGPGSPADPRKLIQDWSMNDWKWMIGRSYSTAEFTNDKLAQFPDGYPVRLADVDFTVSYEGINLYGHSRFAFSARGARYGYVNCSVMGESVEQVAQLWAPLAADAEKVVSSFILDEP
jgi:hypothetical protein